MTVTWASEPALDVTTHRAHLKNMIDLTGNWLWNYKDVSHESSDFSWEAIVDDAKRDHIVFGLLNDLWS